MAIFNSYVSLPEGNPFISQSLVWNQRGKPNTKPPIFWILAIRKPRHLWHFSAPLAGSNTRGLCVKPDDEDWRGQTALHFAQKIWAKQNA